MAGQTPAAGAGATDWPLAALVDLDNRDPATRTLVQDRLVQLLADPDPSVPGVVRAAAGRALGRRVTRSAWACDGLPDFVWVDVAAGPSSWAVICQGRGSVR
ncbi:MAG: hypothetical protein R2854_02150 [Caldilineaceae bacterium]